MMKTSLGGAFLNLYPTKTYWKGATLWTMLFFFRFASCHHQGCDFQNRIRTCKTLLLFIMYFLYIGFRNNLLLKKKLTVSGYLNLSGVTLYNGLYGVALRPNKGDVNFRLSEGTILIKSRDFPS